MFKNTILFIALAFCQCIFSQNTLGILQNTSNSLEAYTLFSPRTSQTQRYTYLIDNCGQIVNKWESEFPLFSTDYLMEDGSLYRSVVDNQSTLSIPGNTGRIEHLDWDGNIIWALTYSSTNFSFHHDYVVLENGNILLLVAHRKSAAEALENGRDPSTLSTDELYEERIIEIEPIGTGDFSIVWEWRSWDHIIQDFDAAKNNFGVIADNPQLIDINFGTNFGEADWWHSNALSYSPEKDQIIISNRNLNEFIIIDHSTTTQEASTNSGGNSNMGGDILYRWGNPQSYDQGDETDQILFGQHDIQFIPEGLPNGGKILMFNNGNGLTFTSIQIIDPPFNSTTNTYDYSGGAYLPNQVDFEYTDPIDPDNFHASFLSGCQQLENGNILICHGPRGTLFEIDSNANTVWKYQSPVSNSGILTDGDNPSEHQIRVFRALKYSTNYAGFDGRDLTPQGLIELNPSEDNCDLLSVENFSSLVVNLKESLVDNSLRIEHDQTVTLDRVEIFDMNGKKLVTSKTQNNLIIDNLNSGLYFARVYYNNQLKTFKFIKM